MLQSMRPLPRARLRVLKCNPLDWGGMMTANPGLEDWEAGIEKFNQKFAPLKLLGLTSPSDFPDAYHLGLLKVGRGQER